MPGFGEFVKGLFTQLSSNNSDTIPGTERGALAGQTADLSDYNIPFGGTVWGSEEFFACLYSAKKHEMPGLPDLPDVIVLDVADEIFDEMLTLTAEQGREFARFAFFDDSKDELVFSALKRGTSNQVAILPEVPIGRDAQYMTPVMLTHTHPRTVPMGPYVVEHLSSADVAHLVLNTESDNSPLYIASVVLTEGLRLLAVRTEKSPVGISTYEFQDYVNGLEQDIQFSRHSPEDQIRVMTKIMCEDFGLNLYVSDNSQPSVFIRVVFGE